MELQRSDEKIIEHATNLSLIEIVLGSLLHSLKIPFAGHMLSLNQGLFLIRAIKPASGRVQAGRMAMEISTVVAIMKSLSPAGKKLGPMISISSQGFLFMLGTFIAGNSILGNIISMALLSLWAFIQPVITYFLIYGMDLVNALGYLASKMSELAEVSVNNFWKVLFVLVAVKIFMGVGIVLLNYLGSEKIDNLYRTNLKKLHPKDLKNSRELPLFRGILKDMTRPFFIFSFFLMAIFFILHEGPSAVILWKMLRAFAIAFLIFYLARATWVISLAEKLAGQNAQLSRMIMLARSAYSRILES